MTSAKYPEWMLEYPKAPESPRVEKRTFHGIEMEGWVGYVWLSDIKYSLDNRRTNLHIEAMRRESGDELSDDAVVATLIEDPELNIEALAKNITLNGLRQPIVLSYYRELLDGNRRYLAHKWIAINGSHIEREKFSLVKAWVLTEQFSQERHILRIITEYNFLIDFKEPWTDFVRAKLLYEEYTDVKNNYSYNDLFSIYGGPGFSRNKIRELIKTYEIIIRFIETADDQDVALQLAAENFIWFQQLQRSYTDEIRNDDEFQQVIFRNIYNGDIRKTDQLKNLKAVRKYREAWKRFSEGDVERAHLDRQILEKEEEKVTEPDTLMDEINARLERLLSKRENVENVSDNNRLHFHELALEIPGQIGDVLVRLDHILRQLHNVTSVELATLPEDYILAVEAALQRVATQARSTKG